MGKKLELKLIEASKLKSVNLVSKMEVYAVVYVSTPPKMEMVEKYRTAADTAGKRNPKWNSSFNFDFEDFFIEQDQIHILIDLRTRGSLTTKNLGAVKVSVKDMLAWFQSSAGRQDCCMHGSNMIFHTFQVRQLKTPGITIDLIYCACDFMKVTEPSGNLKGELYLCYSFTDNSYPCQDREALTKTPAYGEYAGFYPQVETSKIYVNTPMAYWYVPNAQGYPYP